MDGQKCAHEQCSCYVDLGQTFCSDTCRRRAAGDADLAPHEHCGCRHDECANPE